MSTPSDRPTSFKGTSSSSEIFAVSSRTGIEHTLRLVFHVELFEVSVEIVYLLITNFMSRKRCHVGSSLCTCIHLNPCLEFSQHHFIFMIISLLCAMYYTYQVFLIVYVSWRMTKHSISAEFLLPDAECECERGETSFYSTCRTRRFRQSKETR